MQENHNQQPKQDVLYVYDRICQKDSKNRQILQEYGTCAADRPDAQPRSTMGQQRPFGKAFAESQRKRAEDYLRDNPARFSTAQKTAWSTGASASGTGADSSDSEAAEGYTFTDQAGNEYVYRPGQVSGGEAVKQHPFQFFKEQVATVIETIDSRRKSEQEAAKRQAIARKKFTENRHALITAFLLLLVTVLFTGFVYLAFFVIADVQVEGSEVYTAEEIVEAAGFDVGDNLYSFHAGQAEELIMFHCPQIKAAQISRTVPNAVDIVLTDDTAVYYADIYGDTAVLSAGLRVLAFTDAATAESSGLTKLVLPAVKDSVAGRVLTFTEERDLRYVRSVLSAAEKSSLYTEGRIGKIDLSDEYNVTVNCDGMYILQLGNEKDSDLKLRMAYKTIGDDAFDREIPAVINLSDVGEASVRYDMRIVVD